MHTGIALGSNLGDRGVLLERGFAFLRSLSTENHFLASAILETAPVDCPAGSPPFLNAVAEIDWSGTPQALLAKLQSFESDLGRPTVRPVNAPRPLDLDILYMGALTLSEPDLRIPHPRMTQRRFVLQPLAQIRPDLVLPGATLTVRELLHLL